MESINNSNIIFYRKENIDVNSQYEIIILKSNVYIYKHDITLQTKQLLFQESNVSFLDIYIELITIVYDTLIKKTVINNTFYNIISENTINIIIDMIKIIKNNNSILTYDNTESLFNYNYHDGCSWITTTMSIQLNGNFSMQRNGTTSHSLEDYREISPIFIDLIKIVYNKTRYHDNSFLIYQMIKIIKMNEVTKDNQIKQDYIKLKDDHNILKNENIKLKQELDNVNKKYKEDCNDELKRKLEVLQTMYNQLIN